MTRYVFDGTADVVTATRRRLHEAFGGHDDYGDRGSIGFDETLGVDGAVSAPYVDAMAVGGTYGFAGVRGSMTLGGVDTLRPVD